MTMSLLKRILGVKTRDVGIEWPYSDHPVDGRFEPLQKMREDRAEITGLPKRVQYPSV